tara:strand:- start:4768 stop:6120 length:1353 start_codon:yes stop_codon:yes gene_type:complete
MTIKEIKSGTLYKEYSLQIPYDEINSIIDSKIKELLPTVSLPGFRKGKAPLNIVKKKYENNVLNESIESLVQAKTKDLIEEKKLKPFTQPKIDLKKYVKNEPIEVEIKIDLEPKINLIDFKTVNLKKYEIDLDESLINNNYKEFIKSQKKYLSIQKNRTVKKSDRVLINLSTENEIAPEFLKLQKNLPIVIDSDFEILPSIGSKILEKKLSKGEKCKLSLDISKSLKLNEEKLVSFELEIVDVEESVPFKVDKEFLEKNGLKNEEELKNNLKNNFKSQYDNGLKQIEKKELMDILEKEHQFDLPEGILEQEFNDIWHRLEHAKKDGKLDEDDKKLNDEDLKKRYKDISKRRVRLAILLQFIAKENNITVDEKELSNGMMQYASQYPGQEKNIIDYFKNNPSAIETIRGPILEEKVINHILSFAKTTKTKIKKEGYDKLEKKVFEVKKGKQ